MCGIIVFVYPDRRLYNKKQCLESLNLLSPRGPDNVRYIEIEMDDKIIFLGFTRLSIMDLSDAGMQPFLLKNEEEEIYAVCNGEVYNHIELKKQYEITTQSDSDCEVIIPLYHKLGFKEMINSLDAEFATIIVDKKRKQIFGCRDRYGIRPLFMGHDRNVFALASEMKALSKMKSVRPVKPNYIIEFQSTLYIYKYFDYEYQEKKIQYDLRTMIRNTFTNAVKKRMNSDRSIGFLLSGGLDSSLIVAIACEIIGPDKVVCFSVGLPDSSDVIAAKRVAEYLGIKQHHIIPFSVFDGINAIREVIRTIESYDITTIRASVPQYIMAKYIKENTDIRVLMSGEGSDEIHGSYRYFRDAPDSPEFRKETIRLLEELYMFDNLRTDRTMADNGLEVRVPFLDYEYVKLIMESNAEIWMSSKDYIEKKPLRDAFRGYLPDEILYRSKEAFSDAVSSKDVSWYKSIQLEAENIADFDVTEYTHNPPQTKEALYYRKIFNEFYPGRDECIAHYWLPRFQKEIVHDPSATVLKCY